MIGKWFGFRTWHWGRQHTLHSLEDFRPVRDRHPALSLLFSCHSQPLASTATGIFTSGSFLARGLPEVDFIKNNMNGKRYLARSIAWEYFRESDLSKDEVICDYCGEKLKRGGGTSNMLKHLEKKNIQQECLGEVELDWTVNQAHRHLVNLKEKSGWCMNGPNDTDAEPSTSQFLSRPILPKPVQAALQAVFNIDRSRNPMPGNYFSFFSSWSLKFFHLLFLLNIIIASLHHSRPFIALSLPIPSSFFLSSPSLSFPTSYSLIYGSTVALLNLAHSILYLPVTMIDIISKLCITDLLKVY